MSGDAGDDLADDIFGVSHYEAAAPAKKTFLPWHKPRKQYVRDVQWCVEITSILDDIVEKKLDDNALRYCGLPGSDLLDLRCFHESICIPKTRRMRFLGFNSAAAPKSAEQIELNISLDEIMKLRFIDPVSEVIEDDFRTVADPKSMAWGKVSRFGPFDVVNLDLCDSFGAAEGGLFNDNYYNAVQQLLAVQARQMTPWLLLLTTRVGKNHVHPETLGKFQERYASNLKECTPFRDESIATFGIGDRDTLEAAVGTSTGLHRVFLTGICKWLLGLAVGHGSSIDVRSVLGYRVVKGARTTDLVSLAIRFTPHVTPSNDPMNLSHVKIELPNECALSLNALKGVAGHKDVDVVLAHDENLRNKMTARMSDLLEQARYDIGAFKAWAAEL